MTTFRHPRRSGRRSVRRSTPLVAALAVAACGLLAACGGGGKDPATGGTATGAQGSAGDGGVASIVGSTAPDASPSPQAERPLIRPDTSREEEDRLYAVYLQCLEANGLPKGVRAPENGGDDAPPVAGPPESAEDQAAARKAAEACAALEPEELWERSMRLDPTYRDKLQVWVTCLQDKGVDAYADGDNLMLNDGLPPGNEIEECEAEAFIEG
ncbi:hypothetical protein O7623_23605 [Solwaraspora sp. WMMD791]|uniref:hypothetical protein n=1 Tax=Solwaraspora sp. WMMD791 TaxID=3016086 RepID=UPI00249B4C24|nr:hypothetical protein [Solwaraspora sp. WMMD791]WFE26300.1 hypothetical protein O7623_23605 [Solwaraspora sp. WMMD791]